MKTETSTPFQVAYTGHVLHGDEMFAASGRRALLLHGAGSSHRNRFGILRQSLQARGWGSVGFDCIGHGDTGGAMGESSLHARTQQAEAVIAATRLGAPLAIFGASMGAYNALKLAQSRAVHALVLIVPGVYTPQAYDVPFGPEFSSVIRRERSWAGSDAWDILAEYTGALLVIAAEHDAVIPLEIPERLVQAASRSCWRKLHVVPGAEHNRLFSLLLERPTDFETTMNLITTCLGMRAMQPEVAQ